MQFGINAEKYWNSNTGIGIYTNNLIKAMSETLINDKLVCFSTKEIELGKNVVFENVPQYGPGNGQRIVWEQFRLPKYVNQIIPEVMHFPDHTGSLLRDLKCPQLITIHDLSFLRYPEFFNFSRRIYKTYSVIHSVKKANGIIAVSEATKKDVVELLKVPEEKIQTIHNGISDQFHQLSKEQKTEFRKAKNLPEKFVLQVGTLEPRKNYLQSIESINKVRRETKDDIELVVVGSPAWKSKDIVNKINSYDWIHHWQSATVEELNGIYNCAEMFLYPSQYEGFGLPVVEAMTCGCPVVTSNISSLPEVAGDAAILVAPGNSESIVEGVSLILNSNEKRQLLIEEGLKQASKFSWKKTAEETIEYYKEIVRQNS